MQEKPKVTLRQFDTYIAMIENSVGSFMFKNIYVNVEEAKKDATEDGRLSCAFYVSAILYMTKYIKDMHATVASTIKDLKESGWEAVTEPVPGSVIVWKVGPQDTNGHPHIGFYMGDNHAISNDSLKKHPTKHDWKYDGKREVEMILWNPKIN